ncbi:MAG: class I SAM-dependent methyltransferase [Pseudomonadota bacterium]
MYLTLFIIVAGLVAVSALWAFRIWLTRTSKKQLYDALYSMDWGDITTNNYGFAPAATQGEEQYQLQMYEEVYKRLQASGDLDTPLRVLEVSCGRGGGLNYLADRLGNGHLIVGYDWSLNALKFCRNRYANNPAINFVRGSALSLPFQAEAFDVVVNVEASNDYKGDSTFITEVSRILRPDGLFVFADSRSLARLSALEQSLEANSLRGELSDITDNVVEACRLDSPRRQQLIRARLPWYGRWLLERRLAHWAGVEGSEKFERLRLRKRIYFMGCLTKRAPRSSGSNNIHAEAPQTAAAA